MSYQILEKLKNDLSKQLVEHPNEDSQKIGLRTIFAQFKRDAENPASDFTAFRKYLLKHWLADLLRETLA